MISWIKKLFRIGQPTYIEPTPIVYEKMDEMLRNQPVIDVRKKPGRKPSNSQTIRAPQLKRKPGRPKKTQP